MTRVSVFVEEIPAPPLSRRLRWGRPARAAVMVVSLAAHAALLALLSLQAVAPRPSEPAPVSVALIEGFSLVPDPEPPGPPAPSEAPPVPVTAPPTLAPPVAVKAIARPVPAPPTARTIPAAAAPERASEAPPLPQLSAGQLVGARTAGSGAPGRACDMVRWLEERMRRSPRVQSAVARAHLDARAGDRALHIWNGDWIRSPGQAGNGLAGVREAVMMEIAFAPEPCRADPVQGLVVIALGDAPGAPRLAMGGGAWRWADLLAPRRGAPPPQMYR